eukprot:3368522-Rhodomonas_salina.2
MVLGREKEEEEEEDPMVWDRTRHVAHASVGLEEGSAYRKDHDAVGVEGEGGERVVLIALDVEGHVVDGGWRVEVLQDLAQRHGPERARCALDC